MKQKSLGQIAYQTFFHPYGYDWNTQGKTPHKQWSKTAYAVAKEIRRRDKAKGRKK